MISSLWQNKEDSSRCLGQNEPYYVWMKNWVTCRVPLKQPSVFTVNARPLLSNITPINDLILRSIEIYDSLAHRPDHWLVVVWLHMKSEGPSNFLCPGLIPLRSSLYPRGHWHSWHHYAPIWCHLHKTRHIRGEYQLLTSAKRNQEMTPWVRGEQKPEPCWLLIRRRWPGLHRQTRRRKNNQAHSGEWSWRQEHAITDGVSK